jgi:predicted permease
MNWRWSWRRKREQDLERELRLDLELEAAEQQDAGLKPQEARYAAHRALGNLTLVKEEVRQMWGWISLERLFQDLRYAWRVMLRSPGFTAVAVLSVALGIGANTAIFTALDAVLWRPLPVRAPQQLVKVLSVRANGRDLNGVPSTFVDELQSNTTFSHVFSQSSDGLSLSVDGRAERIMGEVVSPNYFSALGVTPFLGQAFSPEVQSVRWKPEAVLAYDFWQRRFSSDPHVIGRLIHINNYPFTIVGVSPKHFFGTEVGSSPELRLPFLPRGESLAQIQLASQSHVRVINAFARLESGVTLRQAEAAVDAQFQRFLQGASDRRFEGIELRHVRLISAERGDSRLRATFARPLALLFAAVGLLLLTACVNVANLLLAKSTARRREIAVRIAIGAGRARILRQLLTESAMLAVIGGALGLAVASWLTYPIFLYLPQTHLRITLDLTPDLRAFAFASCLAILTGLFFGLAPALEASKISVANAVKNESAGSIGAAQRDGRLNLRQCLVAWQMALSLLLMVGAGLLVRSLQNLKGENYGFHPEGVVLFTMKPPPEIYNPEQIRRLMSEVSRRVTTLPGIRCVAWGESGPLDGRGLGFTTISTTGGNPTRTIVDTVSARFFETIDLPMLAGRDFSISDRAEMPGVVILNDTLSKALFGDENPVGRSVLLGAKPGIAKPLQVIGLVRGSRYYDLHASGEAMAYLSLQQQAPYMPTLHVRTSLSNPASIASAVRREFASSDREVPLFNIKTLEARIDDSLAGERLIGALSAVFGIAALMLAAMGVYGVIAYSVSRKTREIGVRMALGATRATVIRSVLREALFLGLLGIAIGLPITLAVVRLLASFLFGVAATDPTTFAVSTSVLATVALIAGLVPAWRASRVDPMVALRHE